MAKYNVLLPLNYDQADYAPGQPVDINDAAQAQALLDLNVIEPVTQRKTTREAE